MLLSRCFFKFLPACVDFRHEPVLEQAAVHSTTLEAKENICSESHFRPSTDTSSYDGISTTSSREPPGLAFFHLMPESQQVRRVPSAGKVIGRQWRGVIHSKISVTVA